MAFKIDQEKRATPIFKKRFKSNGENN